VAKVVREVGDPSIPLFWPGVFLFNTSYDIWGGTGYLVIVNASSDPSTAAIPAGSRFPWGLPCQSPRGRRESRRHPPNGLARSKIPSIVKSANPDWPERSRSTVPVMARNGDANREAVDAALASWRQGNGGVMTLNDLTARDYVESDPLDLDHLSSRSAS
jgi:hypothetical protein